ncbi:MAG: polysulfide reductase NrfD [Ignavibacteria bacterium]|nr:polysulfide reductase NrfD [Ignavibacteria bacterium]MBK7185530.1 polysulfide reductase NrfD [Ignavibacteria bacterium]MBK9184275.1 polysulfide reductase NrfD [Ignavibacteria bacterium]MBL0322176.1 polysulfide reductase NrfD [Ignavibacteria bacterium]HLP28196.1 NrfD/PsrC family molybdoenzyme membrane anchor subunit [Candidatus Didemnitutus sp.]
MTVVQEQERLHVSSHNEEPVRETLVLGNPSVRDVTSRIASIVESKITLKYLATLAVTGGMAAWGLFALYYTFATGIGAWGLNNPIGWGWDITNFVFWIGIGHAGTLISAILFLFRQKWRTAINRSAEAMTIFAVICALTMVLSHTGRPWLFYWLLPYPNQMNMWVNFRSPLAWDVFAVNTYFTVSALFWFIGLIPDLATLRNYVKSDIAKKIYGVLSMGWTGSTRHWHHYEIAYMILAGISTPLVLSVHSVVSFDFTVGILPGWHTTIFPPYFVAGAIFSGFAMVMTLLVITREVLDLKQFITLKHFENMNKIILATGMMVGYAYAMEMFIAWYSGSDWERWVFINRAMGDYAWAYWTMVLCNVVSPQVYWFKKARRNIPLMFIISIFVNIGMWFERFTIIATTLHHDFLPASWGYYTPTWVEISIFIGTFGIFLTLFLLFAKFVPVIAIAEIKSILPGAQPKHHHHA